MKINAIFSCAFRPLFALLALQGLLIIPYWALAWYGLLPLPSITADPLLWHGHEMLFGFVSAAIAGFLLTAVASWTKRPAIANLPLALLCGLWLLARLLWCIPSPSALLPAAIIDIAFDFLLLVLFTRELLAANNQRNLKIAAILGLYTAINIGFYFALIARHSDPSRWLSAALYLIILLITLIGGRVIPLFTGNWLRVHNPECKQPIAFNRFDLTVILLTALFIAAALTKQAWAGELGIAAGLSQMLRLSRWRAGFTLREPLLWSLHLGYAWLGVGFLLNGAALLQWLPASAGLHALTVGTISGLILAMSSRAALGHTGRALTSHPLLTSAFIFINMAAALRVLSALFPTLSFLLSAAAGAWFIALTGYAVRYAPILLGPAVTTEK